MSRYLVERIARADNVRVLPDAEVRALHGEHELDSVTVAGTRDGNARRLAATAVFAMIGALPRTSALRGVVGLDEKGFVTTGDEARRHPDFAEHWGDCERQPHLLETTRRRVFAAGDVRSGSTKRVASAVGDGAMAVRYVHQVLG